MSVKSLIIVLTITGIVVWFLAFYLPKYKGRSTINVEI